MSKKNKITYIERQKNGSYKILVLIKNTDKPFLINQETKLIFYDYTKKEAMFLARNKLINDLN